VQAKEHEVWQLRSSLTSSLPSLATPAHAGAPAQEAARSALAHVPAHMLATLPQARAVGGDAVQRGLEPDSSASLSSHPLRHRLARVTEAVAGGGEAQSTSMVARGLSLSAISHATPVRRQAEEARRGQERTWEPVSNMEPLSNISNAPVSHAPLRRPSPRAPAAVLTSSTQLGTHAKSARRAREALEDEDGDGRNDFLEDYSAGMGSRVLWPPDEAGRSATPAKSIGGGTEAAGARQDVRSPRRADARRADARELGGQEPGPDPLVKQHIREQLQHVEDRAAELEKREMQVEAQRRELKEQVEHHNSKFLEAEKRIQKRVQKLEKLNFRNQLKAYLSDSSATNATNLTDGSTSHPPR
jgi:hypothetical protein